MSPHLLILLVAVLVYLTYRIALAGRASLERREARTLARQRAGHDADRMSREALDALKIDDILELVEAGWHPPSWVGERLKAEQARLEADLKQRDINRIEVALAEGREVSQADLRLVTDARLKAGRNVPGAYLGLHAEITAGDPQTDYWLKMTAAGLIRPSDVPDLDAIYVAEHADPVAYIGKNGRRYHRRSDGSFTYA